MMPHVRIDETVYKKQNAVESKTRKEISPFSLPLIVLDAVIDDPAQTSLNHMLEQEQSFFDSSSKKQILVRYTRITLPCSCPFKNLPFALIATVLCQHQGL
jgi:hypothetical protein